MTQASIAAPLLNVGRAIERNILACALTNETLAERVDLPVSAIESPELRTVYSMFVALKERGHESVTIATLRMFHDSREDFSQTLSKHGGWSFVENLIAKPDYPNFPLHLAELRKRFDIRTARNKVAAALEAVQNTPFETPAEVYAAMDQHLAEDGIRKEHEIIQGTDFSQDSFQTLTQKYLDGGFKNVGQRLTNRYLEMGFDGPLAPGGMYLFTGETNVGKSQLVGMFERHQCIDGGVPTMIADNEMSATQHKNRLVAGVGRIPNRIMRTGLVYDPSNNYHHAAKKAFGIIERAPLYWRQLLDLTIERLEPVVRRFLRQYEDHKHKLLIVDGIKLTGGNDSYLAVGLFAQGLKEMTSKYAGDGLSTIATAQLGKQGSMTSLQKDGSQKHADHTQIGLSKLIADNSDDVWIISHVLRKNEEEGGEALKSEHERNLYCTKGRDHAPLEGNSYIRCEFNGDNAFLEPHSMIRNGHDVDAPEMPQVTDAATDGSY